MKYKKCILTKIKTGGFSVKHLKNMLDHNYLCKILTDLLFFNIHIKLELIYYLYYKKKKVVNL